MSIKNEHEKLCLSLISNAFLHSFDACGNIPKAARENQSTYRLYDSYRSDTDEYKKINNCFKQFPDVVESDKDWLEDEIQQIYPEVLIDVETNVKTSENENFCIYAKWSKCDNDILKYRGIIYNKGIKIYNKIFA